jgi:hypothetical protein
LFNESKLRKQNDDEQEVETFQAVQAQNSHQTGK